MAFDLEASKDADNESRSEEEEEVLSEEAFLLVQRDSQINDEEEEYVKRQVELHQMQEEMMRNMDFLYLLGRSEELY